MHARERRRLLRREAFEDRGGVRGVGEVVHRRAERFARAQDVRFGERRLAGAALGEQVAAQEGARGGLHHQAAVPAVRHVRRVEPAHRVRAEAQHFAVGERAGRSVRHVVDGDHRGDLPAQRLGAWRRRQPFVERAAFVGLEVREADVAQPLDRQHAADGLAHEREQPPRPGVEEQRRVVDDQVLVEIELPGPPGIATGVLMR